MQEWENVVAKDTTEVTWYVGHMREKDAVRGVREDFCETYQTAVLSPGYLYDMSPERFNYMMKLIGRYMGDEQRQAFAEDIKGKLEQYMHGKKELAKLIAEHEKEQETNDQ